MTAKTFKTLADNCFTSYIDHPLAYDAIRDISLSYADGYALIRQVSQKLLSRGLRKGDRVLSYAPLSVSSVVLCWCCFYTGMIFVPVDPDWPAGMLKDILEETTPALVLTERQKAAVVSGLHPKDRMETDDNFIKDNVIPVSREWHPANSSQEEWQSGLVCPEDPAVILYTSGSTGIPKGVVLSQQALFNSGYLVANHFKWTPSDVFMNLGDLHSMSGLRNTCLAPLHAGASFVIASPEVRNHILLALDLVERYGVSYLGVAPTVVRQMNILYSPSRKKKNSSLKSLLCTGGMLAQDQLATFFRNYGIPVLNYYGLTETSGICAGHSTDTFHPLDNSIGYPVGAELLILPYDTGEDYINTGELLVKSDNLMTGYFRRETETSLVLKNGCFYTGDIVRRREDGCLELIGRKRNIIKNIHSELIFLEEIDRALESHPSVLEACTCGYARYEEDEKIIAFVVLKDQKETNFQEITSDLKIYLLEKVGKNRIPWCCYFEEKLPVNSAGKIQRQTLKEKLDGYIRSNRKGYF